MDVTWTLSGSQSSLGASQSKVESAVSFRASFVETYCASHNKDLTVRAADQPDMPLAQTLEKSVQR